MVLSVIVLHVIPKSALISPKLIYGQHHTEQYGAVLPN